MGTTAAAIYSTLLAAPLKVVQCSVNTGRTEVSGFSEIRQPLGWVASGLQTVSTTRLCYAASASKQKKRNSNFVAKDEKLDSPNDEVTEFATMEEWMANKPSGFGQTEYDTSLEERLLEEIEAERKAQAEANAKKGLQSAKKSSSKIIDTPPEGIEVYVGNLPKKRNVARDLLSAFRSARGLLHVRPVVKSDDKVREPECKGLAFLTFASKDDAQDFIERYNGENVPFGKLVKKVTCELASTSSPFKKSLSSQKDTGTPPLKIRVSSGNDLSGSESLSSLSTLAPADVRNSSGAKDDLSHKRLLSGLEYIEKQDDDFDFREAPEDGFLQTEQDIWADLEDEDDYEVDRELSEENSRDLDVSLNMTERRFSLDDAKSSKDLGPDVFSHDINQVQSPWVACGDDEVDNLGLHLQGLSMALNKPDSIDGDKDKRIQELESQLKYLQLQLREKGKENKQKVRLVKGTSEALQNMNPGLGTLEALEKARVVKLREESIEVLEKRVLGKAKAARVSTLGNDSKMKGGKVSAKRKSTSSKKKLNSKENSTKVISKENSSRTIRKLGAGSRLRKRERKIYSEVISKYTGVAEVVP